MSRMTSQAAVRLLDLDPAPAPQVEAAPFSALRLPPGSALLTTFDQADWPDPEVGTDLHLYLPDRRRRRGRPGGAFLVHDPAGDRWWTGTVRRLPATAVPVRLV